MRCEIKTECSEQQIEAWLREIGEFRRLALMRFKLSLRDALRRESVPQCWVRDDRFPVVKISAVFPGELLDECRLKVRLAVHRAFLTAGFPVAPDRMHLRGTRRRLHITARPEWGDV